MTQTFRKPSIPLGRPHTCSARAPRRRGGTRSAPTLILILSAARTLCFYDRLERPFRYIERFFPLTFRFADRKRKSSRLTTTRSCSELCFVHGTFFHVEPVIFAYTILLLLYEVGNGQFFLRFARARLLISWLYSLLRGLRVLKIRWQRLGRP